MKADVVERDAAAQRGCRRHPILLLLGRRLEHVLHPVHVAGEQLELHRGRDEGSQRREEPDGQRAGGEHGAEREVAGHHRGGAENQDDERRGGGERADAGLEERIEAAPRQRDVQLIGEEIGPAVDRLLLRPQCLQRLDAREHLHLVVARPGLHLKRLRHQLRMAVTRAEKQQHPQKSECEDDQGESAVDDEEEDQVEARQQAVEETGQRPGGEDLPNGGVGVETHHQVAGRALVKEGVRERDQVLDEIESDLGVETGAQVQHQVSADQR